MRRLFRWTALLLVVAGAATAAGYAGLRTGRLFERNLLCCDIPPEHNLRISVREALGLLQFPSQIGQDRWVAEKVFPGVRDGYFVDVGSGHGFTDSNTWSLEQRGWTGICIDPFPGNMDGRTCQMFQQVVGSVAGQQVTFVKAGAIGGISDHLGRWKSHTDDAETVELTTTTLGDVLRRAGAPSYIHFISLDIEGAELEALRGFPFDRYSVGSFAIEHNFEEPKRTQVDQLLRERGYERVRTWLQDDFYLPRPRR
jgi:FkbM family methyltransferase